MSNLKPLPSNSASIPSLFLDCDAPTDILLGDATRRVDAVRNLAATLTMISDQTKGIEAKDLSAFALVTEILCGDAAEILGAIENQFLKSKVRDSNHDDA